MNIDRLTTDKGYAVGWGIVAFIFAVLFFGIFMITSTITQILSWNGAQDYYNTITVEGIGESSTVPDIAEVTFGVESKKATVDLAQQDSSKKMNDILAYLKGAGIEEKDIKTTGYNSYPDYEWQQPCTSFDCPPGKSVLTGYTVSQMVTVKIREKDKAGEILGGIGSRGATNISGLTFVVDDPTAAKDEARTEAIKEAKAKAEILADELGVDLKEIVGFYEDNGQGPYPMYAEMSAGSAVAKDARVTPELPSGENEVTSHVTITYKIK